jgi:UDP-glucose 4-epimerase
MDDDELLRHIKDNHRVFHLAGSVGVEYIDKDPSGTLFNNVALNNKLIKAFQQTNRPVIFSSTSEIYGNGPFNEEDDAHIGANKLRWGYATSKLMMEFMMRASSFPFVIVRFFNVVGPGQLGDYGMVLPRFVKAAKNNEDIIIYGDGNQVRSFCHVSDALDALMTVSKNYGELYNIGRDSPITIKQLAEAVIELSGSNSKIVYVPYQEAFSSNHGDINVRVPDISKLRALGYSPRYDLQAIIEDML